jgi:hypothetical protein
LKSSVYFCFYDLSIQEQEVIYTLLAKTFYVIEEKLSFDDMESQLPNFLSNTDYSITFIELIFPIKFDNYLFQIISVEHWNSIKNIIKEIKHRRGNKPVICIFKFKGNKTNQTDFNIIFPIMNSSVRSFEIAIEKVEYLVDIVPTELSSLPNNTFEVFYLYNESSAKWIPYQAKSIAENSVSTYIYKNGLWEG